MANLNWSKIRRWSCDRRFEVAKPWLKRPPEPQAGNERESRPPEPGRSGVLSWKKPVEGLENQFINEIMQGSHWSLVNSWNFKQPQHINLLELKFVEKLVERVAKRGALRF